MHTTRLNMPDDLAPVTLNPNAEVVLRKRYQRKGLNGEVLESPGEMFWRVATAVAGKESGYEHSSRTTEELSREFYDLMTSYRFLPNSPTVKNAALIHKSGGGTGFSFSRLRPRDSRVGSTGGVASGPLSFLRIFNTATEQVKQGGTRRGANMGILRVDHPDIVEFIQAKERDGELNNFNLSVALTEKFMQAVDKDEEY